MRGRREEVPAQRSPAGHPGKSQQETTEKSASRSQPGQPRQLARRPAEDLAGGQVGAERHEARIGGETTAETGAEQQPQPSPVPVHARGEETGDEAEEERPREIDDNRRRHARDERAGYRAGPATEENKEQPGRVAIERASRRR